VARLREEIAEAGGRVEFLQRECGLDRRGAEQALPSTWWPASAALGAVPSAERIVAERFFDEAGGMQLVLHAPFGSRINRAWGLALRKRFCRTFNFELQAAATDNGIVISLGEQHSFPLETVFEFLRADTVEDVLTQALLPRPCSRRAGAGTPRALASRDFRAAARCRRPSSACAPTI
jgi:ATP-dependent Lhr-like helicase